MKDSAYRVFEEATKGGMVLTPKALTIAIRQAMRECVDSSGRISINDMYELTSHLENIDETKHK